MKAIRLTATMGTITAKKDRSIAFRLNTPELTEQEKVAFMELQPEVLEIFLKPLDVPNAPDISVKAQKDEKTPSQRLRNTIYALWASKKDAGEYVNEDFNTYYNQTMEAFINKVKERLDQYE